MADCIYYDRERISIDDIRVARSRAPGAVEYTACGAIWPCGTAESAPREIRNSRDFGYQRELMEWVNRLFGALEKSNAGEGFCWRYGESLLEIARYAFFSDFTSVEQRWRAICEIRQAESPKHLLWLTPREQRNELAGLAAGCPGEIEIVTGAKSKGDGAFFPETIKRIARPPIRWLIDKLRATAKASAPHRPSTGSATDVVFVEYFPNSAKVLIPVDQCLREQHGIEALWLAGRKPVRTLLDTYGVSSRLIDHIVPSAVRRPKGLSRESESALEEALHRLPDEVYKGTGNQTGRSYLLPAIRSHLGNALNEAAHWLDVFHEAFESLKPRCVVSTTYTSIIGRAAAVAARVQGGRSVHVQHGLIPDDRFFTYFCNDLLLVWGQNNRRSIERSGIAADRVKVVGATIYDDLLRGAPADDSRIVRRPDELFQIAFMASRTGGTAVSYSAAELCLSVVVEAVKQIPNARLTVKIHPGDRTGMIDRLQRKTSGFTVARTDAAQGVIRNSDLVLVVSSTTGLEACAADKPLISLNLPGISNFASYSEYEAALEIAIDGPTCAGKLADAIRSLQVDPDRLAALARGRRRLLDDMLNGAAGDAAGLAAKAIADFLACPSSGFGHPKTERQSLGSDPSSEPIDTCGRE